MNTSTKKKKTILFLAANPINSTPLSLDREVREIDGALERSKKRSKFNLEQKWAVTPRDMQRAILDLGPQIVHFSGHGVGEEGLALADESGQAKLVNAEALGSLFKLFVDRVECVVLNACYSDVQAEAIARHVPYVIGMKQAVGDTAAREFAVGFYDALGAGRAIKFAYDAGCTSISMAGIPEHLTPSLRQKLGTSAAEEIKTVVAKTRNLLARPESDSPAPALSQTPIVLDEPEGQIPLDSTFYIERPPVERDCYESILRSGALIRVKAPRQMGKSSLLQRILARARQQGHQTAYLNLQSCDADFLSSIDQFLQWFCASVTNELNLDDCLADYWKGVLGSKNKCTNYFQRYLLSTLSAPLTLGLDEVDQVFQHPQIAQDFFGLLRAWHERGKNESLWQNFRLIIVHSKEVYIPLNINQSPFNVGLPVELPELTEDQVADLVRRHGLHWSVNELQQLMDVVDGHPYLLRRALYHIARGSLTLEKFVRIAPTEEGLYGDHLRRHLINIKADPELEAAMKQVVAATGPVRVDPSQGFKLRSMGLVRLSGNDVVPLCNLYRSYFRDRLGVG